MPPDPDDVTWKQYVDTLFVAAERAVSAALDSTERAVLKAEASTEKRLDSERKLLDNQIAEIRIQLGAIEDLKANERLQVERVDSLRREAEALRDSSDRAIGKTEGAMEKRFEAVNAFRTQLATQAATFQTRDVADAQQKQVTQRIESNTAAIGDLHATTIPRETFDRAIGEVAAWRVGVDKRLNEQAGKSQGTTVTVGYLIAVATLVISFVVLVANGTIG